MQWMARTVNAVSRWSAAHPDIVFALLVTATLRVWFAVWGAAVIVGNGAPIMPNPPDMYHGLARVADEGLGLLLAPWQRWDTIWYLRIAEFGYSPTDASAAFFPFFPLLTRALAILIPNYLVAGLIVSTAATCLAFLFLYRLCADLADAATARRAVIYWAFFPTAFFLFAPYAESTLAACALASIYFARRGQWGLAALAGAGATLARPIGFLVLLPLAIEGWRQAGNRWRALAALAASVGAMLMWMLYLHIQFNDALLWLHAQGGWGRISVIPGETIVWTLQRILSGEGAVANNITDLILTLIACAAIGAAWRKLPLDLSTYALVMIGVPLLSYMQVSGYELAPIAAAGRRVLVAFPAFIALAMAWRGKWKEPLWIVGSATAQVILFSIFVRWLWVD